MNLFTQENLHRLKLGLYGGILFFSFFVIIAVPVTTNNLDFCLLYTDRKSLGSSSNCNYCVAMAVIFGLLYALFRLVSLLLLVLGKLGPDFVLFTDLFQLIFTAVDTVAWFLVFISACILSAGMNSFCGNYNVDCGDVSIPNDDSAVSRMRTAEAGAWISFVLWLVLMVVGIFWLFRQGKLPFLSRPAQAGDGTSAGATGPGPQMETPPASEEPKY